MLYGKLYKTVLIICFCISMSGCASSGVKVDPDKLSKFHEGSTTYAQVIDQFGKPTARFIANGQTTITYSYMSVQARPETFIPIVGAFVGGADSETTMVSLTFDKNGILTSTRGMSSGAGAGHGFEANTQDRKEVREVE